MKERFLLQILLLAQHFSKHVEQALSSAIQTSVAFLWHFISTYYEFLSVTLVIQHSKPLHHIVLSRFVCLSLCTKL